MVAHADEVRKERNKALKKDAALRLAGMIHKVRAESAVQPFQTNQFWMIPKSPAPDARLKQLTCSKCQRTGV